MNKVSRVKRLINFIVDSIVILIICVVMFYTLSYVFFKLKLFNYFSEGEMISIDVFMLIIVFLYYFIFESLVGKTIGKYITGTRVVNAKGEVPPIVFVFIRTFLRFIPFDPITYLFGSIGWHDKYSLTHVVLNIE